MAHMKKIKKPVAYAIIGVAASLILWTMWENADEPRHRVDGTKPIARLPIIGGIGSDGNRIRDRE